MYRDDDYPEKQTISWLSSPVMVERPQTKNFNVDFAHLLFIVGSSYLAHMYLDEDYPEKQTISWLIEPVMVERPQAENFDVDQKV